MKTCTYCGRENDDTFATCRECGTELSVIEPTAPTPTLSQRGRVILWVTAIVAVGVALVAMPLLLLLIPAFAFFYLPIYLPFLLSFAIKAYEWRGMRWSLRVGSVLALFIRLSGMSSRPNFGNDVGGNIAGASHNFAWTWGSGLACAFAAVLVGLLLRAVLPSRPPGSSEEVSST